MISFTRYLRWLLAVMALCFVAAVACSGCKSTKGWGPVALLPSAAQLSSSLHGVSSNDEIWVIARGAPATPSTDESPGSGVLLAQVEQKEIPMPLKHTDVHASISGCVSTVAVTQQFLNPYSRKIEAVYVFPLPHNAAVNEFIMTIGDRHIRGIIRERKEAEQLYAEARRQGYVASLLTEERPNIFTQRVANIEPGKQIDIEIKYFHLLDYADGWYEFVFPMVVGPRFNPPGSTGGIGAVGRHNVGDSGQDTEVTYLRPGERTSHDISLTVEVDAGVPIEQFDCRTHRVTSATPAPNRLSVSLADSDNLPNKDFVLRYRVAGDETKLGFFTHRDERGGFFTLMAYPPEELTRLGRQPLELFFVLDCSGSMSGEPLRQAKAAIERGLSLLQAGDSFQLVSFSQTTSAFSPAPLEATSENVQRALRYVAALQAEGGTVMLSAIRDVLDPPHDPRRLRFVCFLTDGYVGNETEILGEIHRQLGAARIFSFGIGTSVNRYLLDHMAKAGHGAVAYLGPNDSAASIMEDFFTRISHPALTGISIDWGGLNVTEVFLSTAPDLFVGRPLVLAGRFAGGLDTTIRINGTAAGQPMQLSVPVTIANAGEAHGALPTLWARMKIAELADRSSYQPAANLPAQIKQVALDYGLLCPFTAFVSVDSASRTTGSSAATVPVAVPVPEGVKYKTTVDEDREP